MKRRTSLCLTSLLTLLLAASWAGAQFQIIGSAPADGAADLPNALQFCLTFNADLDTTQRYVYNGHEDILLPVGVLVAEPESALSPPTWQWNAATRTLCISISATTNNDYYFLVNQGRTLSGETLASPFELHLSTNALNGERHVAGQVARADGQPLPGIVVALFEGYPLGLDGGLWRAGTVVADPSGDFSIPNVRPGVYYPLAVFDLNGDGVINPESGDLFGIYDSNQDGAPDSLVVGAGDVDGLELTLGVLELPTARSRIAAADALAQAAFQVQDAHLQVINSAGEVNQQGGSIGWIYSFRSETLQTWIHVTWLAGQAGVDTFSLGWTDVQDLPEAFIDSDQAMTITLDNGGAEVEESLVDRVRYAFVGNFGWLWGQDPDRFLWVVHITGWTAGGQWRDHIFLSDAVTGQFIVSWSTDVTPAAGPRGPEKPSLGAPWPNPFNPVVHVPYELDRAQELRLAVYNLAGQQVAELARGMQPAGLHEAVLRAEGWPSALYLVVLEGEGAPEVRRIALLK